MKVNRIKAAKDNSYLHRSFIALYNQDFEDHGSAVDVSMSREDQLWLKKVENGVRSTNERYEIPIPLRDEKVFPNNRQQAEQRAQGLKKRMQRDEKYLRDYSKFVSELIEKDYAEKVSRDRLDAYWGKTWYIPHHGVYHPMKPEKIRVVYDCFCQLPRCVSERPTVAGTQFNQFACRGASKVQTKTIRRHGRCGKDVLSSSCPRRR